MIDVKKLITGFLILAVAGSVSALIIGDTGSYQITSDHIPSTATASQNAPVAAPTGNAFFNDPTSNSYVASDLNGTANQDVSASSSDAIDNPNNLTGSLANAYLDNLVSTNPNGPQDDGTGNPTLTPPDSNSVIAEFASSSTIAQLKIPDWESEAAEVPVIIVSSSSANVSSYSVALTNILYKNIINQNLQSKLGGSDLAAANFAEQNIATALRDVSGLKTPATAASFQRSLIKTFVYAKNALVLLQNAQQDPLRVALIFEVEQDKYNAAIQNLKDELQKAQSQKSWLSMNTKRSNQDAIIAFVDQIVGIPTAHAQFGIPQPVFDVVTEANTAQSAASGWTQIGQMVTNFLKNIALQLIKNTIILAMQHKIYSWIQNSGAPHFVQQWGLELANAYEATAISALDNQFACINPAIAPQVKLLLKIPTPGLSAGSTNVCALTFPSILAQGNQLQNFYNNFSNGGFDEYMALFQPGGNPFGTAIDVQDAVLNAAARAQNAAQTKAVANQGFTGSSVCDDKSGAIYTTGKFSPTGFHYVCKDQNGNNYNAIVGAGGSVGCGDPSLTLSQASNGGRCADGSEPQDVTPGQTTQHSLSSAIDSNFKLVTSATDWGGLAAGLFTSLLQSVLDNLTNDVLVRTGSGLQDLLTASNNGGDSSVKSGAFISCSAVQQASSTFQFKAFGGQNVSKQNAQPQPPVYSWNIPQEGTLISNQNDTILVSFVPGGPYVVSVTDTNPSDKSTNGSQPTTNCDTVNVSP